MVSVNSALAYWVTARQLCSERQANTVTTNSADKCCHAPPQLEQGQGKYTRSRATSVDMCGVEMHSIIQQEGDV